MLQKLINSVLLPRHYWRTIDFDELSELYASMLLRSLAMSMMSLFVPIYLYKIGHNVTAILGYFTVFFLARCFFDVGVAFVVGRIGPKHTIALSMLANILHLSMLLTVKELYWPLWLLAVVGATTNSLFFTPFHTDFSKVKHTKHGGREIGYLIILERIGAVAGPFIGGLLATFTDPKYTIVLSIALFASSLIPLLLTDEVVKVHQKITFKGLSYKKHWRDFVSYAFFNTENSISVMLWNFYLSLVIFTSGTYAKIGSLAAATTAISIVTAKVAGTIVDQKNGKKLRNTSLIVNSTIHFARLFVATPFAAVGVSFLNDPVTILYRMPFTRQFYDAADNVPGYRIVFIAVGESLSGLLRVLLWGSMYLLSFSVEPVTTLKIGFVVAMVISLGIALQPYSYNNQK